MRKKIEYPKVELYTSFKLGIYENVTNVTMALSLSGYLVQIRKDGMSYIVNIYKQI